MKGKVRWRFWVETGLASVCGFLAVLTLFWRDWIEGVSGLDPDHHNGSFEWLILAGLFLVCVLLALAARTERRRRPPSAALSSGSSAE